jgi:Tol biopolymer transport system component
VQVTHCAGDCWSDNEGAWSPDATRVAFGRATGDRSAPGPGLVAIYTATARGADVHQLSKPPDGFEDHYPSWSLDGTTIVFERDKSGDRAGPSQLVAVDVATGSERVVYSLPSWAPGAGLPKVSPDGTSVLFGYWCVFGDACPAGSHGRRNARLATIGLDGTGLRTIPLRALADSGTWSPDGRKLAFRCHKPGSASFYLCTSNLDGSALKRFPWPLGSAHPSWGR